MTRGARNSTGAVSRKGEISPRCGRRCPVARHRRRRRTRRETAAAESCGKGLRSGAWPRRRRSSRQPRCCRPSPRGCATQGRRTVPGWVPRGSSAVADREPSPAGAAPTPRRPGLISRANASLTLSSRWPATSPIAGARLPLALAQISQAPLRHLVVVGDLDLGHRSSRSFPLPRTGWTTPSERRGDARGPSNPWGSSCTAAGRAPGRWRR